MQEQMTKGLSTIAQEAQELKATISQLATALTNNEQAHARLKADMEAAQAKLKALQEASVAAFDELAAIAERREPEAPTQEAQPDKWAYLDDIARAERAEDAEEALTEFGTLRQVSF